MAEIAACAVVSIGLVAVGVTMGQKEHSDEKKKRAVFGDDRGGGIISPPVRAPPPFVFTPVPVVDTNTEEEDRKSAEDTGNINFRITNTVIPSPNMNLYLTPGDNSGGVWGGTARYICTSGADPQGSGGLVSSVFEWTPTSRTWVLRGGVSGLAHDGRSGPCTAVSISVAEVSRTSCVVALSYRTGGRGFVSVYRYDGIFTVLARGLGSQYTQSVNFGRHVQITPDLTLYISTQAINSSDKQGSVSVYSSTDWQTGGGQYPTSAVRPGSFVGLAPLFGVTFVVMGALMVISTDDVLMMLRYKDTWEQFQTLQLRHVSSLTAGRGANGDRTDSRVLVAGAPNTGRVYVLTISSLFDQDSLWIVKYTSDPVPGMGATVAKLSDRFVAATNYDKKTLYWWCADWTNLAGEIVGQDPHIQRGLFDDLDAHHAVAASTEGHASAAIWACHSTGGTAFVPQFSPSPV